MLSLCFEGSRSRSVSSRLGRSCTRLAQLALGVLALGAVACSDSDDDGGDGGTVALADSGVLAELTTEIGIPTTVAVADGTAWVVESQFDRYQPLGGTGTPAPFRLIGLPLAGGRYTEIPLPANFFPEGITATRGGRLFVGSVRTGSIYTIAPDSLQAEPFKTDLTPSTIGMTVGNDNATLWVCNSDFGTGEAIVAGISIAGAGVIAIHRLPPLADTAFCNDMVMSPDGSLWVTESAGGRIFRIPAENLLTDNSATIWIEDEQLRAPDPGGFGINGITLLGGKIYAVVSSRGTLVRIDPTIAAPTGADIETVQLTLNGSPKTLANPDGVTAVPGSNTDLLIVENGLGLPEGKKLLRARIDRQ